MVDYSNDIKACIQAMTVGGTVIYPTDTVWGVGCDATNPAAIDKVFALKQRPANKSMIVLVNSFEMLSGYVDLLTTEMRSFIQSFARPTTVIYDHAKNLADNALAADGSIGIRMVNSGFCHDLLQSFGKPIISSSANISGHPTPSLFREIDVALLNGADYVVYYNRDDETLHRPSRIVRFDDQDKMIVLRD